MTYDLTPFGCTSLNPRWTPSRHQQYRHRSRDGWLLLHQGHGGAGASIALTRRLTAPFSLFRSPASGLGQRIRARMADDLTLTVHGQSLAGWTDVARDPRYP